MIRRILNFWRLRERCDQVGEFVVWVEFYVRRNGEHIITRGPNIT